MKAGYVYIMASGRNGTLYIGVTSDLVKRVWEHRNGVVGGFTRKYRCQAARLVCGLRRSPGGAPARTSNEKWKRIWKLSEIEQMNPNWDDLYLKLI